MPDRFEFVTNAVGRRVPTRVNGRDQTPVRGVGGHEPTGRKHGPAVRSCKDFPANGDKRVASLKEAFQRCGAARRSSAVSWRGRWRSSGRCGTRCTAS